MKKANRQSNLEKKIKNVLLSTIVAIIGYTSGIMAYGLSNMFYPRDYVNLLHRREELVTKIDEWQRFILLMREPLSLQYKDSLQNAIREVGESNARIRVLREQIDNKPNLLYSWAALFMD